MLKAKGVTMVYSGDVKALDSVSLEVPNGHVYSLLGANGAGKSTLMYLFLDFIKPTSGKTIVDDIIVQEEPFKARNPLGYLPDNIELYNEMNGIDNLSFFCSLANNSNNKIDLLELFDKVKLDKKWANEKVGKYSRGMRQKLGLAILLGRNATSFLLDEPTLGLDPQSGSDLIKIIKELKSTGASILMSTHDLMRAQQISDTVGIIKRGILLREYNKTEIINVNLEEIYLEHFEYRD